MASSSGWPETNNAEQGSAPNRPPAVLLTVQGSSVAFGTGDPRSWWANRWPSTLCQNRMLLRTLATGIALVIVGCGDPDQVDTGDGSPAEDPERSRRVYRCDMMPLIDYEADDPIRQVITANSRVVADGISRESGLYDDLTGILAGLPSYTEQDYPFIGYCEHYLIADGTPKALLIGFVCEGHGIVVWEVEADDEGRWMQVSEPTLRGTEEDKAAIREVLGRHGFSAL